MESTGTTVAKRSFGRRSFLMGSAAAMGLAALAVNGCAPTETLTESKNETVDAPEEQTFKGVCRGNCFGGCSLKIKVREGKVVSTTVGEFPEENYNRICARGHSHLQRIYDPNRVKTPIRRVGERGSDEWEQITWDEAIEEISTKWKQYQQESGNSSIAFMAGSGNFGASMYNYPTRLRDKMSASLVSFCYDNAYFYGNGVAQGMGEGYNANEIKDIVNAKTVILWGANPSEAQPQSWHFIMEAKAAGANLITIDPNYTIAASRSDMHVTLRAGTDNILIMAMMNYIVENNWIDIDFIKKSSVGPFLVKASDGKFLRMSDLGVEPTKTTNPTTGAEVIDDPIVLRSADGTTGKIEEISDPVYEGTYDVNGISVTCAYTLLLESCKEWTIERASQFCDIPVDTIKKLTEVYATSGPATIYQGFGPDHYTNGHKVYFTLCAMSAITGNLGKPGACCGYEWTYAGYLNIAKPSLLAPKGITPGPILPSPRIPEIVKNKEIEGKQVDLRSLYIWCSNPVANQTDRNAWIEAFNGLDLVVVADMAMTDTSRYADIVLPVLHWFETVELMAMTSPYIQIQEKAIEPLHESKADVDIVNLLAKAMGITEEFDYTVESYISAMFDNPSAEAFGLTWEQLLEEKCVRAFTSDPYIHGAGGVFPTTTKRLQFYLEAAAPHVVYGQTIDAVKERLPYWEPPTEAWTETIDNYPANTQSEKYPLIYTTERNKMRCHTQWGHAPWLLELYSEPVVKINPQDADSRGIKEGDYVRIFNDRGEAVFKALMHSGTRPGMLIVPKGWEEDQFKKGHYSNLTSRAYNPACPNNCYFDTLVQVEKEA